MKYLHQIKYSIWDDFVSWSTLGHIKWKWKPERNPGWGCGSRMFSPAWTKFSYLCSKYLESNHYILGPGDLICSELNPTEARTQLLRTLPFYEGRETLTQRFLTWWELEKEKQGAKLVLEFREGSLMMWCFEWVMKELPKSGERRQGRATLNVVIISVKPQNPTAR